MDSSQSYQTAVGEFLKKRSRRAPPTKEKNLRFLIKRWPGLLKTSDLGRPLEDFISEKAIARGLSKITNPRTLTCYKSRIRVFIRHLIQLGKIQPEALSFLTKIGERKSSVPAQSQSPKPSFQEITDLPANPYAKMASLLAYHFYLRSYQIRLLRWPSLKKDYLVLSENGRCWKLRYPKLLKDTVRPLKNRVRDEKDYVFPMEGGKRPISAIGLEKLIKKETEGRWTLRAIRRSGLEKLWQNTLNPEEFRKKVRHRSLIPFKQCSKYYGTQWDRPPETQPDLFLSKGKPQKQKSKKKKKKVLPSPTPQAPEKPMLFSLIYPSSLI